MRRPLVPLLLATAALASGCGDSSAPAVSKAEAEPPEARPALTPGALRAAVGTPALIGHLRRLERIAREHGGNRAAGTPGGEASIDMVAGRLRAAGYAVRLQDVRFPFFEERREPRVFAGDRRLRAGEDVATLTYSGPGRAEGRVVRVPGVGCAPRDYAGVRQGSIAVVRRGQCLLRVKARAAEAAGAAAVLIVNDGEAGRTGTIPGSLVRPGIGIPVVGTSSAAGEALTSGARVRVDVDAVSERRRTRNVIAETRTGRSDGTVVLGAHIDSVAEGPGINDDGTGVAALLEMAERLPEHRPPDRRVRFAFWGAEELGLHGSRHYVRGLSGAERRRIGAYVNLDMIGSPNPVRAVYDGDAGPPGSGRIEQALLEYLRAAGIAVEETSMGGGSDHAPFRRAGIPVGGLFTGAGASKSPAQAERFGGRAGRPLDRCYHRACDTLDNVDRKVLGQMADAAAHALVRLADRR